MSHTQAFPNQYKQPSERKEQIRKETKEKRKPLSHYYGRHSLCLNEKGDYANN